MSLPWPKPAWLDHDLEQLEDAETIGAHETARVFLGGIVPVHQGDLVAMSHCPQRVEQVGA